MYRFIAFGHSHIVAFAKGTHTFCVRLPAGACDTDLLAPPREADSRFPALAQKQRELDALTAGEWTRLDPYSVNDKCKYRKWIEPERREN